MNEPETRCATVAIDRGLMLLCELVVTKGIQPAVGNIPLWENGLGDITREFLYQSGVPRGPVRVLDIARNLGILNKGGGR